LRIDWKEVEPKTELSNITGNDTFISHQWRTKEQMEDPNLVTEKDSKSSRLNYVAAWFYRAAQFILTTKITIAFVSTNSICQG
jgi:hypothetical protein